MDMVISLTKLTRELKLTTYPFKLLSGVGATIVTSSGWLWEPNRMIRGWRLPQD